MAEGAELEERLEMARQEMIKAQVSPPSPKVYSPSPFTPHPLLMLAFYFLPLNLLPSTQHMVLPAHYNLHSNVQCFTPCSTLSTPVKHNRLWRKTSLNPNPICGELHAQAITF